MSHTDLWYPIHIRSVKKGDVITADRFGGRIGEVLADPVMIPGVINQHPHFKITVRTFDTREVVDDMFCRNSHLFVRRT